MSAIKEAIESVDKPHIRKYKVERPDGSIAIRYEVIGSNGLRVPGADYDSLKNAREYLKIIDESINKSNTLNKMFVKKIISEHELIEHAKGFAKNLSLDGVPISSKNRHTVVCSTMFTHNKNSVNESVHITNGKQLIQLLNRLDQFSKLSIKVGSSVAIINAQLQGDSVELWGFTTPKTISKIYRDPTDKSIKQFEFNNDPDDVWPRTENAEYNGQFLMYSAFFGDKKSADHALTMLMLQGSGDLDMRNHIIDDDTDASTVKTTANIIYNQLEREYPNIVRDYGHEVVENAVLSSAETCIEVGMTPLGPEDLEVVILQVLHDIKRDMTESQIYSGGNKEAGVRWYKPRHVPDQHQLSRKESAIMRGLQVEGDDQEYHTGGGKGLPSPGTYEQETLPYRTKGQKRTPMIAFEDEQLDEKWSEKYKRSIDCSNPKGFSQRAHCQGRKKHK